MREVGLQLLGQFFYELPARAQSRHLTVWPAGLSEEVAVEGGKL